MQSTIPVFDIEGGHLDDVAVPEQWFETEKGSQALHDYVVAYLANQRAGTGSAKTRAECRGGGAKPYRQKGTGRARAGSVRSPLWRGGGVTFPPKPRSFRKKLNKKVKSLALKRAFGERLRDEAVCAVQELSLDQPKTRFITRLLANIGLSENVLMVVPEMDHNLKLSVRNIPNVHLVDASQVNAYTLLRAEYVLFTRPALDVFGERATVSSAKD